MNPERSEPKSGTNVNGKSRVRSLELSAKNAARHRSLAHSLPPSDDETRFVPSSSAAAADEVTTIRCFSPSAIVIVEATIPSLVFPCLLKQDYTDLKNKDRTETFDDDIGRGEPSEGHFQRCPS